MKGEFFCCGETQAMSPQVVFDSVVLSKQKTHTLLLSVEIVFSWEK